MWYPPPAIVTSRHSHRPKAPGIRRLMSTGNPTASYLAVPDKTVVCRSDEAAVTRDGNAST